MQARQNLEQLTFGKCSLLGLGPTGRQTIIKPAINIEQISRASYARMRSIVR